MSSIKYPDSLDKIIDLARKKGVKTIKIEGIEIELREEAPPSAYKRKSLQIVSSNDKPEQELTEDDYLYWSVSQPEETSGSTS